MIKLNNELRKQLTSENEQYYGDMLIYLRSSDVPQHQTEELLLEMLDHLIKAQQEGRTAVEVFGEYPKAYCDEIIQSLPSNASTTKVRRYAYITLIGVTWLLFVHGILGLVLPLLHIPIKMDSLFYLSLSIDTILSLLVLIIMIQVIFSILKNSVFEKTTIKPMLTIWGLFTLYFAVSIGSHWLVVTYYPHWVLKIQLYPWYSIVLFGVLYAFDKIFLKNIEI